MKTLLKSQCHCYSQSLCFVADALWLGGGAQVFLAGYCHAFRFCPGGKHVEYREDSRTPHEGALEFISLDAHRGAGASPQNKTCTYISSTRVGTGLGCHGNGTVVRGRLFDGVECRFSAVPTQRPAVAGVLHAALAHGNAAVVGPRPPGRGGSSETEVRMLGRQQGEDARPNEEASFQVPGGCSCSARSLFWEEESFQ